MEVHEIYIYDNTLFNDCAPSDPTLVNILFQVSDQAHRWSDNEVCLMLGKPIMDEVETINLSPPTPHAP